MENKQEKKPPIILNACVVKTYNIDLANPAHLSLSLSLSSASVSKYCKYYPRPCRQRKKKHSSSFLHHQWYQPSPARASHPNTPKREPAPKASGRKRKRGKKKPEEEKKK